MATEAGRHQLYEKISTEWGQEHAEELMSYLPPVGWADVATKHDLRLLSAELRAEMAESRADLKGGLDALRAEMQEGFAKQSRHVVTAMVSLTGIFTVAVGLFSFLG